MELSWGTCYMHFFFLLERRDISRQLVALWADSYQPALNLLSRVLPPGLVAYLHTHSDGYTENSQGQFSEEAPYNRRSLRRVLQQRRGRFARGMTSQEPVSPTVYNVSGDLVKKAGASLGIAENYKTLVQDSTSVQSSVSPSGNMMGDSSYAGFLHSGPSGTVAVESVVQTGTHILDLNTLGSVNSDANLFKF